MILIVDNVALVIVGLIFNCGIEGLENCCLSLALVIVHVILAFVFVTNVRIESECVSFPLQNETATSQLGYLHLLHTRISQTIHLPCGAKGPF